MNREGFMRFESWEASQAWAESERERLARCHAIDDQFRAASRIAVKFGEVVVPSRLDAALRYAALKRPGVDPRFSSIPELLEDVGEVRSDINVENL